MAKVKLGALAAQVSGSIGGDTWSHNRFGNYVRLRSIPVQPESAAQLDRRAALATWSSYWSTLSASIRLSWKVWAQNNPIVDRLGDKRILSGHMAFVALNSRLDTVGGSLVTNPPVVAAPYALQTLTIAASVATQQVTLTYTATPIGAGHVLYTWAAKTPTPTINYVKNLLRFVDTSGDNQASPCACANIATKLGALTLGETIIVRVALMEYASGQISTFQEARCQVAA